MEHDKKTKSSTQGFFSWVKNILLKHKKVSLLFSTVILIAIIGWNIFGPKTSQPQYQTAPVQKQTIVQSLGESGNVAVANRMSITTQANGVIREVDVKNGDTVTSGQTIATLSLDEQGQQKQAAALSSYLSAKASLDGANATLFSLQSTMFNKWNTYYNLATSGTYQNSDGSPITTNRVLTPFTTSQDDWLAAEAAYKNQQGVIAQDQAAVTSSWLSYEQASATITAPSAGTIGDVTIVPGMQITNTTSSTNNTVSSQQVASIINSGNPVISVNLSEIDAAKVKEGQKATVTFDALPNKTFSGKVLGINTTGSVSSGVTSYPTTIQLDVPNDAILPNMSATANIIISVKNDVLSVPSSAVQSTGGQSIVRILQNGVATPVQVETGISSDTTTEIISGLTEGQQVITSTLMQSTTSGSASPFGGNLRFGSFGGGSRGGAVPVRGG